MLLYVSVNYRALFSVYRALLSVCHMYAKKSPIECHMLLHVSVNYFLM